MLSFGKLSRQINFVSKCFKLIPKVAGERNNFGPSFYAMDKFVRHSEYIGRKHSNNLDSIRASVQRCVEKPEAKAFTEDIKTLLYLTKEDSDFQLLIKAITKYHSQEASPIFNFRFGAPLMRLAHTLNKSNEMVELYLKEEPNFLHSSVTPGFILMNKLFDERRFDDVLKVFYRLKKAIESQEAKDKEYFPYDALKVAIEANLEKNDDEANKNAVDLFNIVKEIKPMANPSKMITCLFLTAIHRGNNQLANEIYSYLEARQKTSIVVTNLKIISLAVSNKTREALESFQLDNRTQKAFYFKTTLDTLKHSVELSKNDEYKKMLDEVMSKIKSENLVAQSDIKEYATRQVNYTMAEKERLRNERERENSNERRPETDTFKSKNRFGNRQSNDQSDRRQHNENQSGDSANEEFERSNDRRNNNQRTDQNRTQSNSPKNRRQYLE